MARRLHLAYICLAIFLLVLPLVCSQDEENDGTNDLETLLQKLLKAEKERRTASDDTKIDGTEKGDTNDDKSKAEISVTKEPDGKIDNYVKFDGELAQKIIQDCENKYELIMDKEKDKTTGTCFLTKMNDKIYQRNCKENGTGEKIDIKYDIGPKIEDSTLLSKIKGIDGCTGKSIYELKEKSVKERAVDEKEKRMLEERGCSYCYYYATVCNWICVRKAGWWWGEHCAQYGYDCVSTCRYSCS